MDFFTTKDVYPTSERRCHVNFVVLDGPTGNTWEQMVAQILETLPSVAAYVKNDHLGFTIPYAYQGRSRQYLPDYLVRLQPLENDEETRTLIVEVSGGHKPPGPTKEKAETTRDLWLPAVNNHRRVRPVELLRTNRPGHVPPRPRDRDSGAAPRDGGQRGGSSMTERES